MGFRFNYMKKVVILIGFASVFLLGISFFVSAGFFSDLFGKERITGNILSEGYIDGCPYLDTEMIMVMKVLKAQENVELKEVFLKEGDVLLPNKYFVLGFDSIIPEAKPRLLYIESMVIINTNDLTERVYSSTDLSAGEYNLTIVFQDVLTGERFNTTFPSGETGIITIDGKNHEIVEVPGPHVSKYLNAISPYNYDFTLEFDPPGQKISFENCGQIEEAQTYPFYDFDNVEVLYALKFEMVHQSRSSSKLEPWTYWPEEISGGATNPISVTYGIINLKKGSDFVTREEFIKLDGEGGVSKELLVSKRRNIYQTFGESRAVLNYPLIAKVVSFWSSREIVGNQMILDYNKPIKLIDMTINFDVETQDIVSIFVFLRNSIGDANQEEILKTTGSSNSYSVDLSTLVEVGDPTA